ncbi:FkbM family methyltransferase [Aquirufa sp. 5-AUSEE-100C1]
MKKIVFRLFYFYLFCVRVIIFIKFKLNKKSRYIKFIGSEYGGFYINTKNLENIKHVFSFGIGDDISFDSELNRLTNCEVYMFDPTSSVSEYISNLNLDRNFHFYPIGIFTSNKKAKFYKPLNENHISHSLVKHENTSNEFYYSDFKNWTTICQDLLIDKVDILKMDVEGVEFEVLPDILNSSVLPSQICVEMHPRFVKNGIPSYFKILKLFKVRGYTLMAISNSGNEFLFCQIS